ncbi:RNA polymerase sigma factor (sigma-70 family) [Catalinimonas alkaloidigena]|uniref:RNA polymerase sigma factor n=1 Tax=Catalinimonas alkaloidigena TaxID=1075417 RepID=UPI002406794F|nr:sigma-70 family RNA polymerase sigma factor [Catalinimonas alkaloidigena]MDF9796429.1 RNA polymerase sigma factor (sigma-70 family) [Catalinimonas alkaloidigena]
MTFEVAYRNEHDTVGRPTGGITDRLATLPDSLLWKELKAGSEEAYAFIYHHYFFVLYNYGRQFCDSKERVKDCIQDLFVSIWDKKERLSDTDSIKFYLFKSLKREILRKKPGLPSINLENKILEKSDFEMVLSLEHHLIAREEEKERLYQIRGAVNALSDQQREVIFLLFYENLSQQQTAELLSIKVKTVRNLLWKATCALRKIVKPFQLIALYFSSCIYF